MADPTIIVSPLGGSFSEGEEVQIYRLEDTKWSLEVVDSDGTSIVWDDLFDTDLAARAEFQRSVAEEALLAITTGSTPTRH